MGALSTEASGTAFVTISRSSLSMEAYASRTVPMGDVVIVLLLKSMTDAAVPPPTSTLPAGCGPTLAATSTLSKSHFISKGPTCMPLTGRVSNRRI